MPDIFCPRIGLVWLSAFWIVEGIDARDLVVQRDQFTLSIVA